MSKMTDNDKTFGPFTVGPWTNTIGAEWSSGGSCDDEPMNFFRIIAFGWALRLRLPNLLKPFGEKYVWHLRTFGFSLSNMGNGYDFLQIFYGPQTHDSSTTKSWCKQLPWKQWHFVRPSLYDTTGNQWHNELEKDRRKGDFRDSYQRKQDCPKKCFGFEDFDGELIVATTHIEEREWHFGEGWFKWLRFFRKNQIKRSLSIDFSAEVGPEKGSWKGGTLGHGINMLPHELHEEAFRRYCATEQRARGNKKYRLRFISPCAPPLPKPVHPTTPCNSEAQV